MDGLDIIAGVCVVYFVLHFGFLIWVGWKDGPKTGAREERGHGVIPTAMTRDMMDNDMGGG